jgi:acyl-CoA dehydrogenase
MHEEYFTEEHNVFRNTVRKFVEKEIKPNIEHWEEEAEFPLGLYKKLADEGLLALTYPAEYGGADADAFMSIIFTEEMIKGSGSIGLVAGLGSHAIALPPIMKLGTEEQKQKFLVPVLAGEKVAALGITEPNAGSDVANIKTRAVRDGDYYIVNGAKTFITSGCRANFITAAVRTGEPGYKGISLLVIDSSTPGFSVSRKIKKMGWWSSDTAELSFVDCPVPVENLIGGEGMGFVGIMINFQTERLALAVMAAAAAELALEESIKYAKERSAFGRPISGFQVTRHKLVDMATKVKVAKEFNYRVAAKMAAGQDATADVAMAKNFACEICDKVVYDAVQIHGGYGYAREYAVERLYRDSRILSIGGGTTEIMKEIISKMMQL